MQSLSWDIYRATKVSELSVTNYQILFPIDTNKFDTQHLSVSQSQSNGHARQENTEMEYDPSWIVNVEDSNTQKSKLPQINESTGSTHKVVFLPDTK